MGRRKISKNEFIMKACSVHGNYYDYSLVQYKNILIEYDGKQHYIPIKYFGGENALKYVQLNDKIKTNFAKNKGIKLLRIRYNEINNLSEILENNLI